MTTTAERTFDWVEQGLVPDTLIRAGIRRLVRERLHDIGAHDADLGMSRAEAFAHEMRNAAIALVPDKANEQHYEVPQEFFGLCLGPQRKYSSCYWPDGVETLAGAESAALQATAERAGLADGQRVLELGCGWGSLTLWLASRYPASRITAVSNSHSQRAYVTAEAARRGFSNVEVVTADMNVFDTRERFDRVVSVEMFEHMRNWAALFARVRGWLVPGGRFFMHVFTHRTVPYAFVARDHTDWMSRHFFSGGMMPSEELALRFQDDLRILSRWRWNGTHYARTANAWLANLDLDQPAALAVLQRTYGAAAPLWLQRWRIFFMSCAELFGHARGHEWGVTHYLFEPRP